MKFKKKIIGSTKIGRIQNLNLSIEKYILWRDVQGRQQNLVI